MTQPDLDKGNLLPLKPLEPPVTELNQGVPPEYVRVLSGGVCHHPEQAAYLTITHLHVFPLEIHI